MATAVLNANDRFPAGTTVSAYTSLPGALPPHGVPPGAVVTTAVVAAGGSLTFTGLTAGARYWAYAQVSGDDRVVGFTAQPLAVPTAAELDRLGGISGTPVVGQRITLTEAGAAGVYTGSVTVPAGAVIEDILVNGVALWTAGTSATLKVGDVADDDGYYTAVNLKATDLLAGESISFALAGGKAGAYIANSQVSPRYSSPARVVSAIVTTVGTVASTGATVVDVLYSLPVTADVHAAVKV